MKDEVREGPTKTVVVSENIDAVRELIKQAGHVTYREIEKFLGISSSIHSILPAPFGNRSKKASYRLVQRNVGKIRLRCFKIRL